MAALPWYKVLEQHAFDQRALAVFRGFADTDAWRSAGVVQRRRARRAIEKITRGRLPWDEALDRVSLVAPCMCEASEHE